VFVDVSPLQLRKYLIFLEYVDADAQDGVRSRMLLGSDIVATCDWRCGREIWISNEETIWTLWRMTNSWHVDAVGVQQERYVLQIGLRLVWILQSVARPTHSLRPLLGDSYSADVSSTMITSLT